MPSAIDCVFMDIIEKEDGVRACLAISKMSDQEVDALMGEIGRSFARFAYMAVVVPFVTSLVAALAKSYNDKPDVT